MIKSNKRISYALAAVMLSAMLTGTAVFAEGEDGTGEYVEPATDPVVYTTAAPEPEPEPEPEPVYTTAAPEPEPEPEPIYTTAAPEPEPIYTTAAPEYTTAAPAYDPNTEYQQTYSEYQPFTEYYEETPVYTEFENQQQFVQEDITDPTEDQVQLYNTDHDDSDYKELNDSNWKKIAKELAAAQETDDVDAPAVFSKIKKKSSQEPETFWDRISWLLVSGIACFVLAAISLTVFIVMTVKNKKAKKLLASAQPADSDAESSSQVHAGKDGGYYLPRTERSADYGDDYNPDDKASAVTLSEKTKKALKDSSLENTAEIDITQIK